VARPLRALRARPQETAAALMADGDLFGLRCARGAWLPAKGAAGAVLDLWLAPLPALARDGWPIEHARVFVLADDTAHAVDMDPGPRRYLHRNPGPLATLCLQYPRDDAALRWLPEDGLEPFVTAVHRHLMYEEAWRRTGRWPAEDAPHGDGKAPHQRRTPAARQAMRDWART
jgi:hypothetical protein